MRTKALLILAACAATPAFAADPIKIGSVLSVTGGTSFLGEPEDKTLRMYVDEINKNGGVIGRQVKLIVYDDGSDANKARTFATRLVEDEVVAVIGGSSTGTSMAMVPLFEDAQIPFISFAGGLEIVDPVKKYVFKTPHTDRMACQKIFADIRSRGFTKVGMISGTDGFGESMRKQCLSVAPASGVEIVGDENYGPRDSDMTTQLTKLRGVKGIQTIVNAGTGQGPAIVARNHAQLGMANIPLYANQGVASRSYIDLAGPAANGVRLPSAALLVAEKLPSDDPQKAITVKYKTEYEAATGKPVSTFGGQSYDGLRILVEAITRAKSTKPAAIRDEIEKTKDFIGTAGRVTMTPTDHMGLDLESFRMLEIRDGDWVLVK